MTDVGIIGCGSISHFHYEGYERAGARIVHACDVREAAAREVGERYRARVSTDYRELLADPAVELVSVLTTASTHKQICMAAIDAGKGVVCEKTLTDNPESSSDLVAAASRARFFGTAFMKRFFPAAQKAKELLGQMGPVLSIHARTWQPFSALWDPEMPIAYTQHPSPLKRTYGGGVLICGGSHILDLIHWYGGRPIRVCGHMSTPQGLDIDVHSNAMFWLPDGGIAHLETLWHPFTHVGYERNGWDERLEINTAEGRLDLYTVMWNAPEKNGALLVHQDAKTGTVTEYRYDAVNPFDIEMAEMLRRFESGEPARPSAADGYVVDELIAHIGKSAKSGQVVDIAYRA